ncbi:hypothetical protein [Actinoplanes sp. NBRC 101535]|uniref:hypothetical protein n=1 Tax=Actinoplanes sp. NBRC 101535 TaxID=3032196 RepID=UPI0024A1A385|nr:hypothetical protein [Actinoplanes sp. NBRC 101535]GLY08216.1 hypothetical protein Acsp01_85950 [Actinoplanes sp. NBRC 101535]
MLRFDDQQDGAASARLAELTAGVTRFAATVREALGPHAVEEHDGQGGHRWRWTQRGLWTLTVGGLLEPEPVLAGPAGTWRFAAASLGAADLVLLMLHLAAAMPVGAGMPLERVAQAFGQAPVAELAEASVPRAVPALPGPVAVERTSVMRRPDATMVEPIPPRGVVPMPRPGGPAAAGSRHAAG